MIERFRHFAEEAELTGLARSDANDLQDAIHRESYKAETMYRQFAQPAIAGDIAAADRFKETREGEWSTRRGRHPRLT